MSVLYLGSYLPKRSETFVYREVFGLRDRGLEVHVASLYRPEPNLGDARADALASEAITLYPQGWAAMLRDALKTGCRRPMRSVQTLFMAVRDIFFAADLDLSKRLKIPVQYLAALALACRVSGLGVTALHVHMAHAPATVGMFAANILGVPFSFTGHAADLFRDGGLLAEKLRRARFVACISEWHRQWYQSICPRSDQDYPVVRCGVDVPDNIAPPPRKHPLTLLCLGRLVPKKGFDILIEATKKLPFAVHCIIAGDGPERKKLEALAVGRDVRFAGSIDHPQVPALLEQSDIFVLPCRVANDGDRDGIPVVLMEAMAWGIPVITGDLPTIRELVEDGVTGRLVPPGDVESLAAVLSELAADPAQSFRLGAAGRRRVSEEFSSGVNLARMHSAFLSIL